MVCVLVDYGYLCLMVYGIVVECDVECEVYFVCLEVVFVDVVYECVYIDVVEV